MTRPVVAYVLSSYPHGTGEPFVRPEIEWLTDRGIGVIVIPVRPKGRLRSSSDLARGATFLIRSVVSSSIVGGASVALLSRPLFTVRLIGRVLRGSPLRIALRNAAVLPKALWLGRSLARMRVDHVHAYWASTPATVAMIAAEYAGVAWSFTAHRWDLVEPNALEVKATSCRFVRVTSSEALARAGTKLAPPLMQKVRLEYTGIEVPADHQPASSGRSLRLLCPALLIDRKDHKTLLEGLGRACENGVDVELQLAGTGPLESMLRGMISALGIDDRVRFLGQVGHERLLAMYDDGEVDAAVLTSLDEGLPFGLLEAMARGVPVIGTDVGGVGELLGFGGGLLVPPKDVDALAKAISELADPALRRRLAAAARATVKEHFDCETQTRELAVAFFDEEPSS